MLIAEMNGGWIGILQELELRKWFHHKSHVVYFRVAEMIISFSLIPCSIYLFLLLFYSFQFYFLIFIKHLTISYVIISRLLIFFFFLSYNRSLHFYFIPYSDLHSFECAEIIHRMKECFGTTWLKRRSIKTFGKQLSPGLKEN